MTEVRVLKWEQQQMQSSLVPRPPPFFFFFFCSSVCVQYNTQSGRQQKMGKAWSHSSREWTWGGHRGRGQYLKMQQINSKREFLTGEGE